MDEILKIITASNLTYSQKVMKLAQQAENTISPMNIPERFVYYAKKGALCDMGEGNAPYRPRYILVDFARFIKNGSTFLRLSPPGNLDELLTALCIIYAHIPSITGKPVYIGNLDQQIDPFLQGVSDEEAKRKLSLFLNYIDRTIANGYCHANLGPEDTRAGRMILELEKELQNAVPDFTLKYDRDITPDSFAELAVYTSMFCANPAICNHQVHQNTYAGEYGIASCFNILPVCGGAYFLSRAVLPRLADMADSTEHFLNELLPDSMLALCEYSNERVRFLVERSNYFNTSFLVKEGLIDPDRFVGMIGVAGLSDCVRILLEKKQLRYGCDPEADGLADKIMQIASDVVSKFPASYSNLTGGRFLMHAQAGLATEKGVTPGVRIAVGDEPNNVMDHLRHSARFHRFFPTGCSDIFPVEASARNNPSALLDLVKGAFEIEDKYLSFYASDGDLVRITGYLAKRSDIEKYDSGNPALQDTVLGASGNFKNNHVGERKVRL